MQESQEKAEQFQASVKADISSVRADLKAENEKLIKRFEKQNQEAKKELAAKLDTEARRLTSLVEQVQRETEAELGTVKQQIQTLSTDFQTQLGSSRANTQLALNKLKDQMVQHTSKVDANVDRKIEKVDARFVALENKFSGMNSRHNLATDAHEIGHGATAPSVVRQSENPGGHDGTFGDHGPTSRDISCAYQSTHGNSSTNEGMNACSMNVFSMQGKNGPISAAGFLNSSELPLPLFDDSSISGGWKNLSNLRVYPPICSWQ
jgi:hypothetical protein